MSFETMEYYPGDPILGLTDLFAADQRANKVNLGVGIYLDELGRLPLPQCVHVAEERIADQATPRGYIPITGLPAFVEQARRVVFGDEADVSRVASVQTLGGSGALKEAADFLHAMLGATRVVVSDPSWANHQAIWEQAGYEVGQYRYHDRENHAIDFDGMLEDLRGEKAGTVVILHACCHNPTGYDLTREQWQQVVDVCHEQGLIAYLDMAYQGFADGLDEDRFAVDRFLASGQRFFVGNSFSKNFGLYGERVGALHAACKDADEARRVGSQLARIIRSNYSNPPRHGAEIAAVVLADDELKASWLGEVAEMRERIALMRRRLVDELHQRGVSMDFIVQQRGMFSYSGLTTEQMHKLREEQGVYGTDDGRLCVAGLNEDNVATVADAIAAVVKG